MQKITPRTALFISICILLYIALASYHAQSKKKYEEQIAETQRQEKIIGLQSKELEYKQELTDAQAEDKRLRTELSRAQQEAVSGAVVQEAADNVSTQQLQKAQYRINQLQEQLASAKKKLSAQADKENNASRKLLQKLKEREQELLGQKELLAQMQERRRADLQKIAQQEKVQQQKAEQIKETEQLVTELTGRLEQSRARLADATTKLSVANNAVQKARLKAEAMLHYGKEKDRMLAPSEQKAATLEEQLIVQQAQVEQLTVELASARKEIEKGNQNNQQLAEQVTSLSATGTGQQEELAILKEQLQKSGREQREKQIASTSQEAALTEAQAQLEKLTAEKERLTEKVGDLSKIIKEKRTLEVGLTAAQAALEKLTAEKESLTGKVDELSEVIKAQKTT
ncbi:hypothetical protein VU10_03335, partial [Desulfobulbus sp. US1]|nr:hypothetical protein [Desulfobulbus sp. US1]